MNHGHSLFIEYLKQRNDLEGKTLIEIGSVREDLEGQNSTKCFLDFCKDKKMKLVSVDIDSKCTDNVRNLDNYNEDLCEAINMDGEKYLNSIESFDFIYLDSYDYNHNNHSDDRQNSYLNIYGKEINNEDCYNHHLTMVDRLHKISHKKSIICFDDIISETVGKGVKALPYLLENGWNIKVKNQTAVILTKENLDIYVVGNGKSLKDFDFNFLKDREWIGTTLGYRHWNEIGFYPTHYVNMDLVVIENNLEDIKDLIKNKRCETFFLRAGIIELWEEIKEYPNVVYLEQFIMSPENPFRYLVDFCSGSAAALYAYCLQADSIHLLGMDCNYVEFIPESEKLEDGTLKITETPNENPNYYFPTYQRKGDVYNVPNGDRIHKTSWVDYRNIHILYNILRKKTVLLYNYSNSGKLDHLFQKRDLKSIYIV